MTELAHRTGLGLGLLLSAALLAACSATPEPPGSIPSHPTAVAACAVSLGDGWQIAVKSDRPDSSVLVLAKGDSVATCHSWPNAERTDFGNTVTAVGMHPTPSPAVLSYLTNSRTGNLAPFFVGRVPSATTSVHVSYLDGSEQDAVLGGDMWLAWPEQAGVGAPTLIVALDALGQPISQLADADGIQPAD